MNKFSRISNWLRKWKWPLSLAIMIFVAFVGIFFAPYDFISETAHRSLLSAGEQLVRNGFDQESKLMLEQAKEIARTGALQANISADDTVGLYHLIQDESIKRGFDLMSIIDSQGNVLARRAYFSERGDNLAYSTWWGREVLKGHDVMALRKIAPKSYAVIVGVPLYKNNRLIGAFFLGRRLNNSFAVRFKDEYLNEKVNLAFYSGEDGFMSNSFDDPEADSILQSYINSGSDFLTQKEQYLKKSIRLGFRYYPAKKINYFNDEEFGIIVFAEHEHLAVSIILAGFLALLFFLVGMYCSGVSESQRGVRTNLAFVSISLFVYAAVFILFFMYLGRSSFSYRHIQFPIYNSTVSVEPESGVIERGVERTIAVKVHTGGEAINSASFELQYDPTMVEVKEILTNNSFCDPDLFVAREIRQEEGIVSVACSAPTPGLTGRGVIAEIAVQPLKEGVAVFMLSENSQVLANDGLGTNVLRANTNAVFQIIDVRRFEDHLSPPVVFSYSHPNQSRWYTKQQVTIYWPKQSGYTYAYAFTRRPDDFPKGEVVTYSPAAVADDSAVTVAGREDGIYWFNLASIGPDGRTGLSRFKVMIDSTPPAQANIRLSSREIKKGEVLRATFETKDTMSGVMRGAFVKIDDGVFLPFNSPLGMPFFEKGSHTITVRMFDHANNYSDSSLKFKVVP